MFSAAAKTAFLTAALADYNPWHDPVFDLKAELETVHPEIEKAIGEDKTCYDLVHYNGVGTALNVNYLCKDVTDYEFQCAGKDAQPFGKSEKKVEDEEPAGKTAGDADPESEEVADGERRLEEEGEEEKKEEEKKEEEKEDEEEGEEEEKDEEEPAGKFEGEFSEEELKDRAMWKDEQKELEKEAKDLIIKYGALLMCIEKNRYFGWSRGSWLDEALKNMTCEEMLTSYGEGSCESDAAKEYGINVCCPALCNTAKELGCKEHNVSDEVKDAIDQNQTGSKKLGEVCEEHKECAEALQCGSEARPTTPAPETTTTTTTVAPEKDSEETTTTTEEAAEATADETATDGEGRLLQEEENKDEEKAEEESKDEEKAEEESKDEEKAEEEKVDTEEDNKDAEQEETTDEKPTQKKCQKSGASYFGFGFIAALLAVVTL